MGRPVTRFVDDNSAETAAKRGRGVRALLFIAVAVSALLILDAAALGGQLRQTAWLDAQTEARIFSLKLHQLMQFGIAWSRRHY
jgi:hypothetical protein